LLWVASRVGRLTLDFAVRSDKDWGMVRRRDVSVFVGVLVISVLAGGCARKEVGVANTAPIREETTTIAAPVVTDAPTTTATTTTAATVPVAAPGTDPKPVGDDYRGKVIVRAVPKTDLEREIVDAAVDLLGKRRRLGLLNTSDRVLLSEVMIGDSLEDYLGLGSSGPETQLIQVPGPNDRFVVQSVTIVSPDSAVTKVCEVDGAASYFDNDGTLSLKNADLLTSLWEFQLVRTVDGWRIGSETGNGVIEGVDKCEN
jgi:hypothetical protein